MPDRFSEEEARRIFARAAERQHTTTAEPTGLSLAELQEIARASGIDPAHVAAAVAEIRGGAPDPPRVTFGGVDVEPRASRVLAGDLTDESWERIVSRLRRTFGAKGIPSQVGRVREWTSGSSSHLFVTAEPVEGGTRITLESSKAHEVAPLRRTALVLGLLSVLMTAILLVIPEPTVAQAFGLGSMPLLIFLLALAFTWPAVAMWSKKRQGEFDRLLDQIELIVRDQPVRETAPAEAEPAAEPSIERGLLDLDAVGEAASSVAGSGRRRARS